MKKALLLIIIFLSTIFAHAQIRVEKTSKKNLDEMIKNLDRSNLTSGILLDRSMNFSKIELFNSDKNVANFPFFKQVLLDLYNASNKEKFISYDSLKKKIKDLKGSDHTVTLGIINTRFETLNFDQSDPKKSGLKLKNGIFKQKKNKPAFISHHSLIISPLKEGVKGEVISFKFDSNFWFDNSKDKIKNLTISFDSKKEETVIIGGELTNKIIMFSYKTSGLKTITFKATYETGREETTQSSLYVVVPKSLNRTTQCSLGGTIEDNSITADIPFQGYEETSPVYGKIDYRIFYRTNNGNTSNTLSKPVIIIDGFDPGDRRRIQDCDCEEDPICAPRFIVNGQFSEEEHRSIEDMMNYLDTNGNPQNLIVVLRDLGYDVVIVNHATYTSGSKTIDGGADYIERNGLNLTKLIRNLNNSLNANGSNEELVIVGPSMGGQISRYALAYMEKKYAETNQPQWQHNTRLWISVDSPHLGANIPLGLQALINQVKDDSAAARDFADNQLGSAAAKQQLIEQYKTTTVNVGIFNQLVPVADDLDSRTVSQGYSYSRGAPFFQNFYNNLFNNGLPGSKGYPQNLRKISLVNGSMNGSKAYENPFTQNIFDAFADDSEQTVNLRAFQRVITATVHIGSLETFFLPNTNGYGKISRFKKAFDDTSIYMTNNNSRGNMDNVPGGWFPGQYELAAPVLQTSPVQVNGSFWNSFEDAFDNIISGILSFLGGNYWSLRKLEHSHSFISSFSAIGHLSPDRSWAQSLDKNLVCQNLTPFDSYFGHDKNTQHTSFNGKSVDWLLEEMGGNPQDPYFPINPDNLVGSWLMCNNLTRTYAFNSCSTPGDVVNWEVGGGMQIVSSTANSITVHTPRGSGGQGYIRAHFSNGSNVQKDIWIGPPGLPTGITGPSVVKPGFIYSYQGGVSKAAQSYQWELPSPFTVTSTIDMSSMRWNMAPTTGRYLVAMSGHQGADGYIKMRGWNNCGLGHPAILAVEHEPHDSGDPFEFQELRGGGTLDDAIYPNPANTNLTIRLKEFIKGDNLKVILTDITGKVLLSKNYSQELINLDTSKFKNGYYILKIITRTSSMTKKIIIQH